VLREAATASDGVIHLAFKHEEMRSGDFEGAIATDQRALGVIGEALAGSGKPLVGTSGTLMLTFNGLERTGTESDVVEAGPRVDAENAVIALADRGVRSSIVRLPPIVHSSLDHHGFLPGLIGFARRNGVAGYVGDGANRWPAVHTLDAARVYRLALESAPAGSRLHAVADQGIPFRTLAEAIGRHLDLPAATVPPEEIEATFDYLAFFVSLDNPTSSTLTRELLDWEPTHPGLVDDIDEGHYFEE
jgi:nucleoside-diphosphate-sugar epimerase